MFVTGRERVLGDQVGFVEFGTEPLCRVHRSFFTSSGEDDFNVAELRQQTGNCQPSVSITTKNEDASMLHTKILSSRPSLHN